MRCYNCGNQIRLAFQGSHCPTCLAEHDPLVDEGKYWQDLFEWRKAHPIPSQKRQARREATEQVTFLVKMFWAAEPDWVLPADRPLGFWRTISSMYAVIRPKFWLAEYSAALEGLVLETMPPHPAESKTVRIIKDAYNRLGDVA